MKSSGGNAVCFWNGPRCFPSAKMTNRNVVCGNTRFQECYWCAGTKKGLLEFLGLCRAPYLGNFWLTNHTLSVECMNKTVHPLLYIRKKSDKSYSVPPSSFSQSRTIFFHGEICIFFLWLTGRFTFLKETVVVSKLKDFIVVSDRISKLFKVMQVCNKILCLYSEVHKPISLWSL